MKKNLHIPEQFKKIGKNQWKSPSFSTMRLWAFIFLLSIGMKGLGQTNSYLGLDGGFEGSATIDNTNTGSAGVSGKWTKSTATATIANETATVRSGANSLKVSSTSATLCRVFSPSFTVTASTTKWVVQCYRRSTSTANTVQFQLSNVRGGTEQANGTYAGVTAANTWEKVTYAPITATSATTAVANFLVKALGTGGDVYLDDIALYESSTGVDGSAPNAPNSVNATVAQNGTTPTTKLDVSWTAATGGVDGGGYIVVRGTSDPTTAPNTNGIYASGNTVATGMTVVYVGTGTSFTDVSLTAGTQYFYRVYTYDKAYNYSSAITGNGTTGTACSNPVISSATPTQPTCGTPTGSIAISATGTSLEYSKDNSTWQSGSTISGLSAATYSIYVRSTAACVTTYGSTVTINAAPTAHLPQPALWVHCSPPIP